MLKMIISMTMLLLLPLSRRSTTVSWYTSAATFMVLSFLTTFLMISPHPFPVTISPLISLDMMSAMLITLTFWITSLMFLASYKTLLTNASPKNFIMVLTILAALLIIAFSVNNFILFYIFFEASLIPTLFLILAWGYQPERLQASMYLMMYTVTASLPLLLSLLIMFSKTNNLSLIVQMWVTPFHTSALTSMWWTFTIVAFLVKMPLYFFHLWLPKAHVEAPVAGSMILAAILLKLGSYGLMRVMTMNLSANKPLIPILMSVSLWGAIITSLICLRQPDLKALIAYSSVGHMGIMTAGLISSFLWGWFGSLIMMLSHGLCSSALFMLANMTYDNTNTRSMFLTKGLLTVAPSLTLWWLLFSVANMAAPPSMNLIGEIFLLTSIIAKSLMLASMVASLSFLAAAYSLHLYTNSQHGPLPVFSNPAPTYIAATYTPLFLHLMPIMLLLAKGDTVSHWIS